VLVTVSNSPSVDQLAAAVGFTLTLNKMGKHATAVYSGDTPSTIEFLTPEATLEKNTDSLRDFIVSLDKSKADKLRYKVEDNVVKIFITPYKTSLSEKDLNFTQGDFNVDAVVALGVSEREQLDQAIVSHGRILHDATVITVSAGDKASSIGAINWQETSAASLCEMLVGIGEMLQPGLLDNQIATAYLTGIVAQTERFRNDKTTPKIMTMSAQLMAAGANQQLIASSLDKVVEVPLAPEETPAEVPAAESADGSLSIEHEKENEEEPEEQPKEEPEQEAPKPEEPKIEPKKERVEIADAAPKEKSDPSTESALNLDIPVEAEQPVDKDQTNQIDIDDQGNLKVAQTEVKSHRRFVDPLPGQGDELHDSFAGSSHPLTAFGSDDGENEPNTDPLGPTLPADSPSIFDDHATAPPLPTTEPNEASSPALPPAPASEPPSSVDTLPPALDNDTLRDIEKTFDSAHIAEDPTSTINEIETVKHSPHVAEGVNTARDAVSTAINAAPYDTSRPQPLQALNAAALDLSSGPSVSAAAPSAQPVLPPAPDPSQPPANPAPPASNDPQAQSDDPNGQSPPPVPPPLLPVQ